MLELVLIIVCLSLVFAVATVALIGYSIRNWFDIGNDWLGDLDE